MRYLRFWLCTAFLFIVLAPSPSDAEPPKTPSIQTTNRQLALDAAHQGLDAYDAGRFEEAYAHFRKAQDLYPAPTLLVHMARCQRKLGKLDAAKNHYQEILATPLAEDAPPPFVEAHQDAKRELTEVNAEIAARASISSPSSRMRVSIIPTSISLGFGVVGVGIGAWTGALSQAKVHDIRRRCQGTRCLSSDSPAADDARTLGNVSTAAFVVGGAAMVAGGILLVLNPGNKTKVNPRTAEELRVQLGFGRIELHFSY